MIPVEAVERAAKKFAAILANTNWEHMGPLTQDAYRNHAREVLEAAAPYIQAQAWDEAIEEAYCESRPMSSDEAQSLKERNPYRPTDAV